MFWIAYTQAGALNAFQMFLQESKEDTGLNSFFDSTINNITVQTPVGAPTNGTTTAVGRDIKRFPAENLRMTFKFPVGTDVLRVRLQVAEYGAVLTPGSILIEQTHARKG